MRYAIDATKLNKELGWTPSLFSLKKDLKKQLIGILNNEGLDKARYFEAITSIIIRSNTRSDKYNFWFRDFEIYGFHLFDELC